MLLVGDPEAVDSEAERFAEDGKVDLQAVVTLQGTTRAKPQAMRALVLDDATYNTNQCAAVADGVAVGDFLILVRLHEQAGPGAAEHRLQIGFDQRAVFRLE